MPADALDLLNWPSVVALFLGGIAFGAVVVGRRGEPRFTTFLAIAFAVVFFAFLIPVRAATPNEHWGRTFGTAIQCVIFALGLGVGVRTRAAI